MRALLIDVDSTIPNLALMQLSTWKKEQGYETELVTLKDKAKYPLDEYDETFASIVFRKNRDKADIIKLAIPNADIGGVGYDLNKSFPPEVSRCFPDYSLYPDCDFDLGFTSRGCCRNCYFCVVPKKEGCFRRHQHPREFHDPAHKKIVLMDNNILTDKDWFFEVTDWIVENKLKVDFNQGLDIRLLDEAVAKRLKQLRPIRCWRFAFDDLSVEDDVRRGVQLLKDAGISVRNNVIFYVYVHNDAHFESAVKRCHILRELGTLPFIMWNREEPKTYRITDLRRWCRPWIFFKTEWKDYDRNFKQGE